MFRSAASGELTTLISVASVTDRGEVRTTAQKKALTGSKGRRDARAFFVAASFFARVLDLGALFGSPKFFRRRRKIRAVFEADAHRRKREGEAAIPASIYAGPAILGKCMRVIRQAPLHRLKSLNKLHLGTATKLNSKGRRNAKPADSPADLLSSTID